MNKNRMKRIANLLFHSGDWSIHGCHRRVISGKTRKIVLTVILSVLQGVTSLFLRTSFHLHGSQRTAGCPIIGVHTVFIAKENILFLREWIIYHQLKGISHFFLYDNIGVTAKSSFAVKNSPNLIPGRVSKHNIPYADMVLLTDTEVSEILISIQQEFRNVHIIQWQPRAADGQITYGQVEAQNAALRESRGIVDWMVFMDMDEYLVSSESIPEIARRLEASGRTGAFFYDRIMASRFADLGKYVTDVTQCPSSDKFRSVMSPKYLCKVRWAIWVSVHYFLALGGRHTCATSELMMLHYQKPRRSQACEFVEIVNPISSDLRCELKKRMGYIGSPEWKLKHSRKNES